MESVVWHGWFIYFPFIYIYMYIFVFHLFTGHDAVYAESGQGNLEHWECSTLCLAYTDLIEIVFLQQNRKLSKVAKLSSQAVLCLMPRQTNSFASKLHHVFSYYFNPFPNLCLRACNLRHSRGPFNGYSHPSGLDPFPEASGSNIRFQLLYFHVFFLTPSKKGWKLMKFNHIST